MGTRDRRVGLRPPIQLPGGVRVGLQPQLDPGPGPVLFPLREPVIDRLPGPVTVRDLMPLRTVFGTPQDPVDHLPVITLPATTLRIHTQQQRLQPGLLISQITSHDKTTIDHAYA
jgi:hypothetical protein